MNKAALVLASLSASTLVFSATASAATIAIGTVPANVTASSTSTSYALGVTSVTPSDGYYLFATTAGSPPTEVGSAPTYATVSVSGDSSSYGFSPSTSLTADGVTYTTGVAFKGVTRNPNAPQVTMATITLTAPTVAPFTLGVLMDNFGGSDNDELNVVVSSPSTNTSVKQTVAGNSPTQENDFYYFYVTGGVANDTIYISTGTTGPNNEIGGLTFDSVPAPEPASLGLVGASLFALGLRRRRR